MGRQIAQRLRQANSGAGFKIFQGSAGAEGVVLSKPGLDVLQLELRYWFYWTPQKNRPDTIRGPQAVPQRPRPERSAQWPGFPVLRERPWWDQREGQRERRENGHATILAPRPCTCSYLREVKASRAATPFLDFRDFFPHP